MLHATFKQQINNLTTELENFYNDEAVGIRPAQHLVHLEQINNLINEVGKANPLSRVYFSNTFRNGQSFDLMENSFINALPSVPGTDIKIIFKTIFLWYVVDPESSAEFLNYTLKDKQGNNFEYYDSIGHNEDNVPFRMYDMTSNTPFSGTVELLHTGPENDFLSSVNGWIEFYVLSDLIGEP
jgi:hypothetical protein